MPVAITRGVSASLASCELTHLARAPIDLNLACAQHAAYEAALERAGCRVVCLPPLDDCPDAVFVEDVAVVLDEIAIVTRPGAESRRGEVESVARALGGYRSVRRIEPPGTLDGGDVLRLGRRIYVGLSGRSNQSGIEQLGAMLAPHGYEVTAVPVTGCLHLKSAVTEVALGVILVNPEWVNAATFVDVEVIEVDPAEPYAANGLFIASPPAAPAPAEPPALSANLPRVVIPGPDPSACPLGAEGRAAPGIRPWIPTSAGMTPGTPRACPSASWPTRWDEAAPSPESRFPTPDESHLCVRLPPSHSTLIYPASFPRTRARLEAHGIRLEIVDVSELQKAEGAVTCCSLVFRD